MMLGLLLWYEQTEDERALDGVRKMADAMCDLYLGRPEIRMVDTGFTEMNLAPAHSFALLYKQTGVERYLEMARQLVDQEFSATGEGGEPLAAVSDSPMRCRDWKATGASATKGLDGARAQRCDWWPVPWSSLWRLQTHLTAGNPSASS